MGLRRGSTRRRDSARTIIPLRLCTLVIAAALSSCYSRRSVRNRLVAFKCAAIFLVRRAALRAKTRTPELGKKGNLLNTTLRVADLAYSKPIAIWSATIDGNWFRVSDAVVSAIVTGILLYSNQGWNRQQEKPGFNSGKMH